LVGLLGKLAAPGDRDHVPLWLCVLGGVGGALLGTWVYGLLYADVGSTGLAPWRTLWQLVGAALFVAPIALGTGRTHRRT
jgi:hypothetical protein